MQPYDVAIIGAGPAGATAALLCARSGLKTVVVEKKKLPRSKSCAGGVTARAMKLLQDIGCFDDLRFEKLVNHLMIHYPATGESCELLSKEPYLATVRRADFDAALIRLAAAAGAEIREAESFAGYRAKSPHRLEIKTDKSEFYANVLIGADGFYSLVRKQLHHEMAGAISFFPMMFGIECDIAVDQISSLSPDHCHLYFNIGKDINYGWAFPKKNEFNIGLVLDAGNNAKSIKSATPVLQLQSFLKKLSGRNIIWNRVGAAPIPLFGSIKNPTTQKGNILLVGDAAGYVDAWTGEGIYYGIKSAILAHHVIQSAFSGQEGFACLSNYTSLCKKFICGELSMSFWVSEMFKKIPSFYDYLHYPKVRQLFLPHTQGKISYRKALFKAVLLVTGYKLRLLSNKGYTNE